MGIDHRGAHILLSQELLDCADVLPSFQQVRRKGMAEGMASGGYLHSGIPYGSLHALLHHAWIQMITRAGPHHPVGLKLLPSRSL